MITGEEVPALERSVQASRKKREKEKAKAEKAEKAKKEAEAAEAAEAAAAEDVKNSTEWLGSIFSAKSKDWMVTYGDYDHPGHHLAIIWPSRSTEKASKSSSHRGARLNFLGIVPSMKKSQGIHRAGRSNSSPLAVTVSGAEAGTSSTHSKAQLGFTS